MSEIKELQEDLSVGQEVDQEKTESTVVTKKRKKLSYGKEAYLEAAEGYKERLILNVILDENTSYTKEEVEKALKEWKSKEV